MTTLIPLLSTYFGVALLARLLRRPVSRAARMRLAAAVTFISTGIVHFTHPQALVEMVPPVIPAPEFMVAFTGVAEIAGALGLLLPRTRNLAALCLVALLVGVLPANIYAAVATVGLGGHVHGPAYLWIRIPVQAALILWVLRARLDRC